MQPNDDPQEYPRSRASSRAGSNEADPEGDDAFPEEIGDSRHDHELDAAADAGGDPLTRYLRELRQFPLLTRDEEVTLAAQFRNGDREAGFRLVTGNLRLVVKIAMLYRRVYPNVLDLIQEGNIGLIQAAKRFEPSRGVRVGSYAGWWIRAYIIKFITDNARMVRIGTTNDRRTILMNLARQRQELEAKGITPTAGALAERLGVDEADVVAVERGMSGGDVSLDAPIAGSFDGETLYLDTLRCVEQSVDDKLVQSEFQRLLRKKFDEFAATLSELERFILRQHLAAENPLTQQQIATRFTMTRGSVAITERKVMTKLRKHMAVLVKDLRRMDSGGE